MTYMPRFDAATTADWPDLVAELDRWGEAGRVAALWWRDDDAVGASRNLSNLLRLAGAAPVALAVMPALMRADLVEALDRAPSVSVLQHGWRHLNWAGSDKKSEYPKDRARAVVAAELAQGRHRLAELFGERACPVFVPPWNRFAPELLPMLLESGMTALSTMASPKQARSPDGLMTLDVHVDLIDWRGDRGFIGTAAAIDGLLARLRAQRLGAEAAAVPIGVLTHHLVMDRETTVFLDRLGSLIGAHDAVRWIGIAELL